ncbi:MAG: HAD family hydrolase [Coriobacteriia bacterium]|nr:HAD family hydrolase [Coriobacteriia bacterium]
MSSKTAKESFSQVKRIYTDIDGTLLAPGGKFLTKHDGKPSFELAKLLVELKEAEIDLVLVSGRNRASLHEMVRQLNLDGFIAELGTIIQRESSGISKTEYILGAMDFDLSSDKSPFEAIQDSGVVDALLHAFPGRLEYSLPYALEREVTPALRGNIDEQEAQRIIDSYPYQLDLASNGLVHPKEHTLTMGADEPIYIYHLLPRGVSKGSTLAYDMEQAGLSAHECVALGDSEADLDMASYVGSFVLMNNGLQRKHLQVLADKHDGLLFKTNENTIDGWCEFAQAILASQ